MIVLRNLQAPSFSATRFWFGKPRNYLGEAVNKVEVMSDYKFALVIENDQSFVSEKLFDALFAGCVPIYVGANLDFLNLPSGLVFESGPTVKDLRATFDRAQDVDFDSWSRLREGYLSNPATINANSSSSVFKEIARFILDS